MRGRNLTFLVIPLLNFLQGQMYDSQGRRPPGMGGSGYPDGGQYGQYPSSNQRYPMQQGYPQQVLSILNYTRGVKYKETR